MVDNRSNRIRSLTTRFRLRHTLSGCLLKSHAVTLPEWGFKQAEVLCSKKSEQNSKNVLWNIEQHSHDKRMVCECLLQFPDFLLIFFLVPPGGSGAYRSKFTRDLIDLNIAMWQSNNALTPDPEKEDQLTSKPYQWPLMLVGLRMCGWGDDAIKFWLIGNPVVWWGSTASLVGFLLLAAVYGIRWKRGWKDWEKAGKFNHSIMLHFNRRWTESASVPLQGLSTTSTLQARSALSAGSCITLHFG